MKYRLTISGNIEFGKEDEHIRLCLLDKKPTLNQTNLAIQELEEEATDIEVKMVLDERR